MQEVGSFLFKFRSGTHGLNEELGIGIEVGKGSRIYLCGAECKSVVHVLWECPAYIVIVD